MKSQGPESFCKCDRWGFFVILEKQRAEGKMIENKSKQMAFQNPYGNADSLKAKDRSVNVKYIPRKNPGYCNSGLRIAKPNGH